MHHHAIARFHLVSGAGSESNLPWVHPVAGTLYSDAVPGWARLDFSTDGAVAAAPFVVDRTTGDGDFLLRAWAVRQGARQVIVILNLSGEAQTMPLSEEWAGGAAVLSTHPSHQPHIMAGSLHIPAHAGFILC